jgi:hypothetical protein
MVHVPPTQAWSTHAPPLQAASVTQAKQPPWGATARSQNRSVGQSRSLSHPGKHLPTTQMDPSAQSPVARHPTHVLRARSQTGVAGVAVQSPSPVQAVAQSPRMQCAPLVQSVSPRH